MATKLPDNELIGGKPSSGADSAARVPPLDGRERGPAQPGHVDAAKRRPDPSTAETISQDEEKAQPQDSAGTARLTAAPASQPAEAELGTTPLLPATSAIGSERAEIARRIAAFRNLQIKLKQDRESYFDETMAQAREMLSGRAKP